MWPIGHAAGAYLLLEGVCRSTDRRPGETAVLILAVASQLPDLLDKPLSWYFAVLPTGRSLSHSLLFVVPLCLLFVALALHLGRLEWGAAFAIGTLSHLFFDALPALWEGESTPTWLLYPVLSVEPYEEGPPSVIGLLMRSLEDPYFYAEFVLFVIAFLVWRERGYPGLRMIYRRVRGEP